MLAAQNISASLVADDRFQTVHSGLTDPPYYLNCSEQGKAPPYSHLSAKNLWYWGETNYRLISSHPDCLLFWAQRNDFFFQLFTNVDKTTHCKWKIKRTLVLSVDNEFAVSVEMGSSNFFTEVGFAFLVLLFWVFCCWACLLVGYLVGFCFGFFWWKSVSETSIKLTSVYQGRGCAWSAQQAAYVKISCSSKPCWLTAEEESLTSTSDQGYMNVQGKGPASKCYKRQIDKCHPFSAQLPQPPSNQSNFCPTSCVFSQEPNFIHTLSLTDFQIYVSFTNILFTCLL